jgi:predicted transcriptional regulator
MTDDKLERLLQKKRQIEAKIKRIKARENAQRRKLDTRRKILAGAAVLEHAKRDEQFAAFLTRLLDETLKRESDRKLFDLDEDRSDEVRN